jgi:hypothetical protein
MSSEGKCPFTGVTGSIPAGHPPIPVATSTTTLSASDGVSECPAFKASDACPFKDIMPSLVEAANKCPHFKDGCPMKDISMKEMLELCEKCPAFADGKCPFSKTDTASLNHLYKHLPANKCPYTSLHSAKTAPASSITSAAVTTTSHVVKSLETAVKLIEESVTLSGLSHRITITASGVDSNGVTLNMVVNPKE